MTTVPVMLESWCDHVSVVHDCCSCGAATQGLQTFEHYQDPETGKEGKVNVGVTVGHYRGNKLVRANEHHYCFSSVLLFTCCYITCSAQEQQTGHTSSVPLHTRSASLPLGVVSQIVPNLSSSSG